MPFLDLHVGRPLQRGAVSLFPVWSADAVDRPGYDLAGDVRVDEHPDGGVIASLLVTNAGTRPALLLAGELLAGGQQHRTALRSTVVEPSCTAAVEVRCVEEGRWSGSRSSSRAGRRSPVRVRAGQHQGEVWRRVREYGTTGTHPLLDVREPDDLRGVRPLPGQVGLLVGLGGQPLLLEVFDAPSTLAQAWDGLLGAVAVDAGRAAAVPTPGRRARRFLDRVRAVRPVAATSATGTALRAETPHVRVEALHWGGSVVHAVALDPRHELMAA